MLSFLIAQATTQPTLPFDPTDLTQLSTVGAIVGITIALVSLIRANVGVGKLAEIPVWAYVVVVSTALTVLANKGFGTLGGSLPVLIYQAAVNSLLAVGINSTFKNLGTPAGRALTSIMVLALMLCGGGCSQLERAELVQVREGLNEVNQPIHQDYLQWAQEKHDAGQMSDAGLDSCRHLVARHAGIIAASRARDAQTPPPLQLPGATPSLPLPN